MLSLKVRYPFFSNSLAVLTHIPAFAEICREFKALLDKVEEAGEENDGFLDLSEFSEIVSKLYLPCRKVFFNGSKLTIG